jgi:ketosteroid isomerase-like protein
MVQDDIEIKKVVDQWAQAIRDGNMDGILYRQTTDVVMLDVPMSLQNVGLEEYKKEL